VAMEVGLLYDCLFSDIYVLSQGFQFTQYSTPFILVLEWVT